MGDGFQLFDDGFLVTDDGFAVHEDCCCCGCCSGGIPDQFDVTFTNLAVCSDCFEAPVDSPPGDYFKATDISASNTTVRLSKTGPCTWEGTITDGIEIEWYSDASCTSYVSSATYDVTVELNLDERDASHCYLWAYADLPGGNVTEVFFQFVCDPPGCTVDCMADQTLDSPDDLCAKSTGSIDGGEALVEAV